MASDPVSEAEARADTIEVNEPFWRVLLEPAIPIIVLAGCVHLARRNADDVAYFFGTAAIILIDRQLSRVGSRTTEMRTPWFPSLGAFLAVAALFAVALAQVPRAGWISMVGLAIPGLVGAWVVLGRRESPLSTAAAQRYDPGPRWVVWPVLGVLGCLWELASFLQQPDTQHASFSHPTLSSVIDPLVSSSIPRAVLLFGWLIAGYWLMKAILFGPRPRDARPHGTKGHR